MRDPKVIAKEQFMIWIVLRQAGNIFEAAWTLPDTIIGTQPFKCVRGPIVLEGKEYEIVRLEGPPI
jgi:hypothetical protein